MRRLLALALVGCGAHAPAPTTHSEPPAIPVATVTRPAPEPEARYETWANPAPDPPAPPEPAPIVQVDAKTLYSISIDRVPAQCQAWKRDDETDEYRWSRRETGYVHTQRLTFHATELRFTDERQFADSSINANTCDQTIESPHDDAVTATDGTLFLTQKACTTALAKKERVAFIPRCRAKLDDEAREETLDRFIKIASSRGTMYSPRYPEVDHPAGSCETIRFTGTAPDANEFIAGTAAYGRDAKRPTETHAYRISLHDKWAQELTVDGTAEGSSVLEEYEGGIQTFELLYFTRSACDAEIERARWQDQPY